jgi:hypothetical protein
MKQIITMYLFDEEDSEEIKEDVIFNPFKKIVIDQFYPNYTGF